MDRYVCARTRRVHTGLDRGAVAPHHFGGVELLAQALDVRGRRAGFARTGRGDFEAHLRLAPRGEDHVKRPWLDARERSAAELAAHHGVRGMLRALGLEPAPAKD